MFNLSQVGIALLFSYKTYYTSGRRACDYDKPSSTETFYTSTLIPVGVGPVIMISQVPQNPLHFYTYTSGGRACDYDKPSSTDTLYTSTLIPVGVGPVIMISQVPQNPLHFYTYTSGGRACD